MSSSELLHKYFDEGLDSAHEDVLFERLSNDADLRREFNEHLRIHASVQNDLRNIGIPAAVTEGLFTRLGVHAPHSAAAARPSRTVVAAFQSLLLAMRHALPYAYTSVATAAATIVIMLSLQGSGGMTPVRTDDAETAQERLTGPAPAPVVSSDAPVTLSQQDREGQVLADARAATENRAATESRANAGGRTRAVGSGITGSRSNVPPPRLIGTALAEAETPASMRADAPPPPKDVAPDDSPALTAADPRDARTAEHQFAWVPATQVSIITESDAARDGYFFAHERNAPVFSNLVFEMRVLNGKSFPSVDLPEDEKGMFRDIALSIVYKASDHHAFGIEYGRESFGLEFSSSNPDMTTGQDVSIRKKNDQLQGDLFYGYTVYEETVVKNWIGAVWKLSMPELGMFDFVYPYARTMIGGTSEGPMGKLRLGFEIYPTNYAALNIGAEGTVLRYQIENSWFQTTKLGVTFGLSVGF